MLRTSKIGALVRTCSAGKFPAFTFITPLFGVLASYFILHEPLTPEVCCRGASGDRGSFLVTLRIRRSRFPPAHCWQCL